MTHEEGMREALKEARRGMDEGFVPIGCAIVHDGVVIARGRNGVGARGKRKHAEYVALEVFDEGPLTAEQRAEAVLYTTLEPCMMCLGMALNCRIRTIVYAQEAQENGAVELGRGFFARKLPGPLGARGAERVVGGLLRPEAQSLWREYVSRYPDANATAWAKVLGGT